MQPVCTSSSRRSYHLHDEVTAHEALLGRLLETRVLRVRRDTEFLFILGGGILEV